MQSTDLVWSNCHQLIQKRIGMIMRSQIGVQEYPLNKVRSQRSYVTMSLNTKGRT